MRRTKTKTSKGKAVESRPKQHDLLVSTIENREVLKFFYEGFERIVEPQTYGKSHSGRYVLRALQTGGTSSSGQNKIAKLFDVARISKLQKTSATFEKALATHNPNDSAMAEVFATLPKPN